jgi:hypothetical protein
VVVTAFTRAAGADVAPDEAAQRHRDVQQQEVLRRRQFAIYGLDARWRGSRWLGGWGTSNNEIDHIELAHGNPFDETAALARVATWRLSPPSGLLTVANAAHALAEYLWEEGAPHELVRPTFTSEDPTASWSELVLSVDGHPTPFRSLAAGPFWVALAHIGTTLITAEARRIIPHDNGLVTINDVEPYLDDPPSQ